MGSDDLLQVRSRAVGTFHVSLVEEFMEIWVIFWESSINNGLEHLRDV